MPFRPAFSIPRFYPTGGAPDNPEQSATATMPCGRLGRLQGLIHFSVETGRLHGKTLAENMNLTPWRCGPKCAGSS